MPYRLTKIYTRKGDDGYTNLGERRISKDDLLVEAIGTVDELNSAIGLTIAMGIQDQSIQDTLKQIQNHLFDLGGQLHMPAFESIKPEMVTELEKTIDLWNGTLPPLKEFVLPGGNRASAACHMARTICRRAERILVRLNRQVSLSNIEMLRYLNRLSDLLFVCSRMLAKETQAEEVLWDHERKKR